MSRKKGIPRFFWYTAGIVIIYFVLVQMNILPSLRNLFTTKRVIIDSTPVLVKEVKAVAQLMTIANYDEVVVDTSKSTEVKVPGFPESNSGVTDNNELVLIAHGKIVCGADLAELDEKAIFLKGDSVSLKMPAARVLEAIVNPSDLEIFIETGTWAPDEVNQLKVKAREKMITRAREMGLLDKAAARNKVVMENFLRMTGFKRINLY